MLPIVNQSVRSIPLLAVTTGSDKNSYGTNMVSILQLYLIFCHLYISRTEKTWNACEWAHNFTITLQNLKSRLTVRHLCSDGFIEFAGRTEPGLILGKHSKHIFTAFKQPGRLVLQRRG